MSSLFESPAAKTGETGSDLFDSVLDADGEAISPIVGQIDMLQDMVRFPRAKGAQLFMGLPASTYLARGVLIRITVNLFGDIGQSWGLVNGAIGTVAGRGGSHGGLKVSGSNILCRWIGA